MATGYFNLDELHNEIMELLMETLDETNKCE